MESASVLPGEIRFYRSAEIVQGVINYSAFTTNKNGLFYVGVSPALSAPYPGLPFVDDGLNYSIHGYGIDPVSGLQMSVEAPVGSSVVSLITSLIYATGEQARTKHALQLDNLGFALSNPDRDLRTFSWVRALESANAEDVADARRIRAANIRLYAYLKALEQFQVGPGYDFHQYPFTPDPADLAALINTRPGLQLYTAAGAETVLQTLPRRAPNPTPYRDDVIAAAAHLISLYCVAVGPVMTDDDVAAKYMLGTQGFLLRRLWELGNANSAEAAARVQAMGITDVYEGVAPFAERAPASTTTLFAVPDFIFLSLGGTVTIPFFDPFSNGSPSIAGNDSEWFVRENYNPLKLTGITVPARFAGAISATQQPDQSVLVEAKPGFTGVAWFDYAEQTPGGITASSRAYVIVK